MIDLSRIKKWNALRWGCAPLMGMASVMSIAVEVDEVHAGWFALPGAQKPASTQKPKEGAPPQSTTGFSVAIRKLMLEAKAQEEQGNLDRAMTLADRAHKLSENPANGKKPALDVSPATTRGYLNELRQKNAERIARRQGQIPTLAQSRGGVQEPSESKSVAAKEATATRKKFAITKIDVSDVGTQNAVPRTGKAPTIAAAQSVKRPAIVTRPVQKLATDDLGLTEGIAPQSKAPTPPASVSDDPFADDLPEQATSAQTTSASPSAESHLVAQADSNVNSADVNSADLDVAEVTVADLKVAHTEVADENWTVQVTPMPPRPSKEEVARMRTVGSSARFKLRASYVDHDQTKLVHSAVATTIAPALVDGPLINPMNKTAEPLPVAAPLALSTDAEPNRIQPAAAEQPAIEKPAVERSSAGQEPGIVHLSSEPDASDIAASLDEEVKQGTQWADAVSEPETESLSKPASKPPEVAEVSEDWAGSLSEIPSEDDFDSDKVLQLKRRLDSVTSLQPGEIASVLSVDLLSDSFNEPSDDWAELELPIIHTRRTRHTTTESSASDAAPRMAETARPPVIGHLSMIKWRVAKDDPAASSSEGKSSSKSASLPSDLRQQLRDVPTSTSESRSRSATVSRTKTTSEKSATTAQQESPISWGSSSSHHETPVRPLLRGSLWDNATAPSIEGYSGSIAGALAPSAEDSTAATTAPLPPPTTAVEQTSFDTPDELFKRRRQSKFATETKSSSEQIAFVIPLPPPEERSHYGQELGGTGESAATATPVEAINEPTESLQVDLAKGPVDRLAYLFGISKTTAATMLGALMMLALLGGMGVVRALVRDENSQAAGS